MASPRFFMVVVLGASLLGGPAAAIGDDAPATVPGSGAEIAISDRQLLQFAAAYNEISPLRRKYAREIREAESEEERARIRDEADREWVRVIEAQGLDVTEFQLIGRELNARRPLQERMNELMRDR